MNTILVSHSHVHSHFRSWPILLSSRSDLVGGSYYICMPRGSKKYMMSILKPKTLGVICRWLAIKGSVPFLSLALPHLKAAEHPSMFSQHFIVCQRINKSHPRCQKEECLSWFFFLFLSAANHSLQITSSVPTVGYYKPLWRRFSWAYGITGARRRLMALLLLFFFAGETSTCRCCVATDG